MKMWIAALATFVTALATCAVQTNNKKSPEKNDSGKQLRSSIDIAPGKFGKALAARSSPALVEGSPRFRKPPLTIECWAKLDSKKNFNILVASDTKSSSLHWEIYSYARNGFFSAYLPGMQPSEIISNVDICDGKWHYLAMQYDGRQVNLFVDGKKVHGQKVQRKPGLGPEPGPLTIGMALYEGGRIGCDGLIDEVRIANAIRPIRGVPAKAPVLDLNTVGLWHFDSLAGFAADPAWTPRPITGANVPAWWRETDKDWVDGRLRQMNTGTTFNATIAYPSWRGKVMAYRATAIRVGDKSEAAVIFDRNQLRLAAGWTGDYLQHTDRRFGLLNTPRPAGEMMFATASGPGWDLVRRKVKKTPTATTALPREWGLYHGMYRHGKRVVLSYRIGKTEVLDSPWLQKNGKLLAISRTIQTGPARQSLRMAVCDLPSATRKTISKDGMLMAFGKQGDEVSAVALVNHKSQSRLQLARQFRIELILEPHARDRRAKLLYWRGPQKQLGDFLKLAQNSPAPADLREWTKPGQAQWTENITTRGKVAKDNAPFVIDTLTLPYQNPYKALLFLSGLDFLPNGNIAVCSVHGDVWLVSGVDDTLEKLTWKRFATGLYQPLGLKVVDGKIIVLERGQLTRLHDTNGDGEADFYECMNDQWHISGGEHSYDTCLETDPDGNFYFFNTGDWDTPTGGCLLKVSKDGGKREIFATGFRHPIGQSVSSQGIVTGADQEGNWMPGTRIDIYTRGGFYGDMRSHHRNIPPKIYDGPLCWLPREMDNSAGGQVWVPKGKWGPLSGQMLHLSYGRCRMMLVLRQQVGQTAQAGAVDLGLQFLSGIMRGRFHSKDGHLYVCGMDGWQTAAIRDGCLQRVRYTGKKVLLPVALNVHANGIRLTFAQPLDRAIAEDTDRYRIEQWNYHWSGEYGSKRWSVAHPKRVGQDRLQIQSAKLLSDGKSVFLQVAGLGPVMQMQINYNLRTKSGEVLQGTIYNTIHRIAAPLRAE